MTSYFSRLIQQTGMTVGPEKRSPQPNMTGLELGFPAIEQESLRKFEQVPSEPLPNRRFEVADVVNPVSASLDRPPNSSTTLLEVAPQRSQPTVERDISLTDGQVAKVIEVEDFSTSVNQNMPTPPVNQHTEDREAIQPAIPTSPEQQTEPTSRSTVIPQDRQTYLQAVREWVAKPTERNEEPPMPHGDLNPPTVEMSLMQENKLLATAILEQTPLTPRFQETTQSTHVKPPEAQNFVLSIGTISLTIEQPQKEVQRHQPTPAKPERVVPLSNPVSRLNRHYIRLR